MFSGKNFKSILIWLQKGLFANSYGREFKNIY